MKRLLCNFKTNDTTELKKHYLNFHQVNLENRLFKGLFKEQNNVFHGKQCIRCKEFLPTAKSKSRHNFFKHYEVGRSASLVEEKSIAITLLSAL